MKTLFNRLFLGALGLILCSFTSLSQSQSLLSDLSNSTDVFIISSEIISQRLPVQPYELDLKSPSTFLSHDLQRAVLSAVLPLQSFSNPAKGCEHAEATYPGYFSRPPPQLINS